MPPGARWLDLIADGTNLLRLDLVAGSQEPLASAESTIEESPGLPAAEWLLAAAAESILRETWDRPGPDLKFLQLDLTEIISVLTDAGAIAADSPTPGHLAALCRELGVIRHGITALQDPVSPFERGWRPWLSWWLKVAGHWHMAIPVNYLTRSPDTGVLALRLTPPLTTYPDTIEVVVTGTSARIRAVVPVPGPPGRAPSGRPDGPEGGTLGG
jgi:hypothetical protein